MSLKLDVILDIKAGRELDALVAIHVMGFNIPNKHNAKFYSTDISDAWEIAEKFGIVAIPQSSENGFCWLALDIESVSYRGNEIAIKEKNMTSISSRSVSEAICKAALLSKLYNET